MPGKSRFDHLVVPRAQLQRRHVDGHARQVQAFSVPGGELRQGQVQHLAANLVDEAALFGKLDEMAWPQNAQVRMAPAHQRLGAAHACEAYDGLRLVIRQQLVALQRIAQVVLQRQQVARALVELRRKQADPAAARLLGLVHGQVGVAHELFAIVAMPWVQRHANAGGEVQAVAVHVGGLIQRRDQFASHLHRFVGVAHLGQQHRKFIAAQAGHGVGVAQRAGQALRHLNQRGVAHIMAQRVVDELEAVQVNEQKRQRVAVPVCHAHMLLQPLVQGNAVGQAG